MKIWFYQESEKDKNASLIKKGKARLLFRGCYTSIMNGTIESVCVDQWYNITKGLFPDFALYGISAFYSMPQKHSVNNKYYLLIQNSGERRKVSIPGLDIMVTGHSFTDDNDFYPYLSEERIILENLMKTRLVNGIKRTVDVEEIEEWMEKKCRNNPDNYKEKLLTFKHYAEELSVRMGYEKEYDMLSKIISQTLGTHPVKTKNKNLIARNEGFPYDKDCISILDRMKAELGKIQPVFCLDKTDYRDDSFQNFIESYFSNYIEGTKFAFDDAESIIFKNTIVKRKYDALDVQNTYKIVSDYKNFVLWNSFEDFINQLQQTHYNLMKHRDIEPGKFKTYKNMAGNTLFVLPELVMGTLKKGYESINDVEDIFSKALLFHQLLVHIHPFNDGNGRSARIFMNQLLTKSGLSRIIIPNVGREDYIDGIKEIINNQRFDVFYRNMIFFQKVSSECYHKNNDVMMNLWTSTYAFQERTEERLRSPINGLGHKIINGIPYPEDWQPSNLVGIFKI